MNRTYCVFNQSGESFIGLNIQLADTPLTRLRGLLGKWRMKSGDGIWVVPSHGIHTMGVLVPIDLIYLDADYRVIHLVEHLHPFRIAPFLLKSASVLELPMHTIFASQTRVGDQLLICLPEEIEASMKKASPIIKGQAVEGAIFE